MSREAVVRQAFAAIDAMDPDKFVKHLTQDVVFRFGNAEPTVGRTSVQEAVSRFFASIAGMKHQIERVYEIGDAAVVQIEIEYTRKDGRRVTVPNADILTFEGELVRDWRIYIDVSPVYADL
ncbi:nuclear transport factor 2 family protein [uncultured Mycobacterium sp.]|uniref:nuclear transport factor 2 family protein n=1 Tax=uncultured Mycobacterium sp. TaxID=171292 RepID=UPI0035CB814E